MQTNSMKANNMNTIMCENDLKGGINGTHQQAKTQYKT